MTRFCTDKKWHNAIHTFINVLKNLSWSRKRKTDPIYDDNSRLGKIFSVMIFTFLDSCLRLHIITGCLPFLISSRWHFCIDFNLTCFCKLSFDLTLHEISRKTNMAAPGERKYRLCLFFSVLGIVIGLSVFCVFGFHYKNWNASLWGLSSGNYFVLEL